VPVLFDEWYFDEWYVGRVAAKHPVLKTLLALGRCF